MEEPPLPPPLETVAYPRPSETPVPRAAHKAADWLFWMVGLSVVNLVALAVGSQWSFFFSFGISDLAGAAVHARNPLLATIAGFFALLALIIAVVAALRMKKGKTIWAYLVMVPVGLDLIVLFMEMPESILALGFHAYIVFLLFGAGRELKEWNRKILG